MPTSTIASSRARLGHGALSRSESVFWSLYAQVYDLIWDSPLIASATEAVALEITRAVPPSADATVVDLGCGTGLSARPLTQAGYRVIGVDSSKAMLAQARRLGRMERTVVGEAAATGLPAGVASACVMVNVLHLHHDPAAVIAEAARVVRPGGVIGVVWPAATLSRHRVIAAERALGRPLLRIALADIARQTITLPARVARIRRRRHGELAAMLAAAAPANGATIESATVMFDSLQVTMLRVATKAPNLLAMTPQLESTN